MKKLLTIVILSILAFLLVSCGNDNTTTQITPIINAPVTMTTYEVYDHPTGIQMDEYVIEKEEYDNSKALQKQKQIEQLDEYETKTKVWNTQKKKLEEGEFWSEEARIEDYCLENGYLKCIKITETCIKSGCYKVAIECEDYDFDATELEWDDYDKDDECEEYNIVVEEDPYITSSCY
jgi:hypothetical protein